MKIEIEDPIIRQNVEYLEKTHNLEFFQYKTTIVDGEPIDEIGFTDKTTGLKWRNLNCFYDFLVAGCDNITMKVIYVKVDGFELPLEFVPYDWNPEFSESVNERIEKMYNIKIKLRESV